MSGERAPPPDTRPLRDEVVRQAKSSMLTALAIHDAALTLEITCEFERLYKNRETLHRDEVVGFLLTYGKAVAAHESEHIRARLLELVPDPKEQQ